MLGTHAHEHAHTGTAGSFTTKTPLQILEAIYRMYPNADKPRRRSEWRDACEQEGEVTVLDVWDRAFDSYTADLNRQNRARPTPEEAAQRAAARAASDARIAEAAERSQREWLKNMMRLDFKMPNGKILGDCIGTEVGMMGGIAGAFWAMVAAKVSDRLVKEVLSNEDLQAMVPDLAR
jgi:hypothetical protein